jgi:hypothetical protein
MQPSLSLSSKSVRPSDLKSLSQVSGSRFRLVAPTLSDDDPVLQGDFRQVQLRPGFFLHCADTHELYDLRTEAVQRPGLTISLFLKGEATAWFGGRKFHMGPGRRQGDRRSRGDCDFEGQAGAVLATLGARNSHP